MDKKDLEIIIRGGPKSGKATIGQLLFSILKLMNFEDVEYYGKVPPAVSLADALDSLGKLDRKMQKIEIKTMMKNFV